MILYFLVLKLPKDSYIEEEIALHDNFYSDSTLGSYHLGLNNVFTVFDIWKSP